MNKKKAIRITVIVLSVILISAVVISLAVRNNSKKPGSSSNPISSSTTENPLTSETPSAKPSEESTSQENTESTSKKKNEKPSSNGVDILVNAKNPIPDDWSVNLVQLKNGHQIDKRAYDSLQKMMDDARAKGWNPLICSSYRTTSYQQQLFDNRVQRMKNQGMSEKEAMEHCYDYGFILRYPEDKVRVTGIDFEPWHYRYVGYDIAQYIKQQGICLEEYKSN